MTADRILVSHAGTLPRPDGLKERLVADPGSPDVQKELAAAVADVVRKQADMGIDIVNDGEFSKVRGFSEYVRDRLGGLAGAGQRQLSVMARDARDFPGFVGAKFSRHVSFSASSGALCAAPLTYVGAAITKADIDNLKAATRGLSVTPYLPAIAPGTIEHWLVNKHYARRRGVPVRHRRRDARTSTRPSPTRDSCCRSTIRTCPMAGRCIPDMSVADYRKYADAARRGDQPRAARHSAGARSDCTCAGAAATARTRTTFRSRDIIDIVLAGQGAGVLDRGRQSAPRARVAGVAGRQAAGGQVAHARRGRPRHRHHRASRDWSPIDWCGTPGWSARRTSSPAPIAASPRA